MTVSDQIISSLHVRVNVRHSIPVRLGIHSPPQPHSLPESQLHNDLPFGSPDVLL